MDTVSNIYVCNLMGDLLYPLDEIDKSSVSLTELLNGQWELSFTYTKSKDADSPAYEALEEGMYLYVEDKAQFKMRQPAVRIDAATETKTVKAYSCETEFEDKNIQFDVNIGEETSLEFLVQYNDGETEILVNPYTGIPYDWIVLYNTYPQQLTKLQHILDRIWVDRSAPLVISDADDDFEYINGILTLIPRLVSRAEEASERVGASLTVAAVTGQEEYEVEYTLEQFVTTTQNADGDTTSITLDTTFPSRVERLITYYETYRNQLSLLDLICAEMDGAWVPGKIYGFDPDDIDGSDYTLCNQRYQFSINENGYSFLTSTYAQRVKCVVTFDRLRRKINITPVEHIGEDTGITLDYDKLLNSLDISTNEDTLATRITVYGSDSLINQNLSLEQVNFGSAQIVDIDYKMNARDRNGKRIYVTDELAEKYANYKQYREEIARPLYVEKTKEINTLQQEIYDLKYRLPADSMQTDWDTFTDEELEGQLKYYTNLLYALQELYAADYGYDYTPNQNPPSPWVRYTTETTYVIPDWITVTSDTDMMPRIEVIRDTIYWWDYVAYRQTITQIMIAMQARFNADVQFSYKEIKETDDWYDHIHAWETRWELYGTVELQNKIDSYSGALQAMTDAGTICVVHTAFSDLTAEQKACLRDTSGGEFDLACRVLQKRKTWEQIGEEDRKYFAGWKFSSDSYVTLMNAGIIQWEPVAWNDLSDAQKALYGNAEVNYFYNQYNKILTNRNNAESYLNTLQGQIDDKQRVVDELQAERKALADAILLPNYEHPETGESFTSFECKVINLLYRDAEYKNDFILATSLDDTVTSLDKMEELYQDGVEKASIFSRPQLVFTAEVDNLLALDEFKSWLDQFKLGNYCYIAYRDGQLIRLRMVGCTYNPCMPTNSMSLQFSTLTYSKTEVTDIESVLGSASPTASSGGGSSAGGAGGGTYGDLSDLGVTLSDTMLRKLLTKESFNKEVSQSVKDAMQQQASMQKIAVYQGLKNGTTDVNGDCLTIGNIKSSTTTETTIWTPFFRLGNVYNRDSSICGLQWIFGLFRDKEYVEALKVLRTFIEMYSDRLQDLDPTEQTALINSYWNSRSVYQRGLFAHSSAGFSAINVFTTMINRRNELYTTVELPVSILRLDDGTFSYCGGNFKYGYDGESIEYVYDVVDGYFNATNNKFYSDALYTTEISPATNTVYRDLTAGANSQTYRYDKLTATFVPITGTAGEDFQEIRGKLYVRGHIDATSGNIGGMHIDEQSTRPVGEFLVSDAGITFESDYETMYLQRATKGINPTQSTWYHTEDGQVNFLIKRPIVGGNSTQDHDYVSVTVDYVQLGQSRPTTEGGTTSVILNKNGDVHASGTIDCGAVQSDGNMAAGGAVSGNSLAATNGITGKRIDIAPLDQKGNTDGIYLTGVYTGVGSYARHHVICAQNKASGSGRNYSELRPDGDIFASGNVKADNVSDFAEYYEWLDGNTNAEDRTGRFVTTDGAYIRLATSADNYILGIISATATFIGNTAEAGWHDRFLKDTFGRTLITAVDYPAVVDEDGNIIEEAHTEYESVINPDYDPTREYIPREQRPEWAPVGLVGQIIMLDDGTCEVNGFATSADEGIATKADGVTNYRVIKRIDSNHIMVAAK